MSRDRRLQLRGRRAVDGELAAMADRVRLALAGTGLAVFTMDRALRYTWMENPARDQQWGDVIGRTDADFLPAEAAALLDVAKRRVVELGESIDEEIPLETDGGVRWFRLTAQPLVDDDGTVSGLVGQSTEITAAKAADRELQRTRMLYQAVVDNSPDMIRLADADGTLVFASNAHERILGYTPEELVGRATRDIVDPADLERASATVTAILEGAASLMQRGQMRRKDGTSVPVEERLTLIHDADSHPLVLTVSRDLTSRLELESQLRQSQKMEAVGQLAGGIAHDFNNILVAITGYSELALEQARVHDGDLCAYLEEVIDAGERARDLTQQLLAFSGRQPLKRQAFSLNESVEAVRRLLDRLLGDEIAIVLELAPALPACLADPRSIEQVLLNLAINARDAMPGGGTIEIATELRSLDGGDAIAAGLEPGDYLALRFADDGTGMDDATVTRIFEPFFTTKEPGRGTGLGLATAHGIVVQSGGAIQVESAPGAGTTFTILLPHTLALPPSPAPRVQDGGRSAAKATLLVIEDDARVRRLVQLVLEHAGYTVLAAANPEEAEPLAAEASFDLLLTDIVMPGGSGVRAAARLRSTRADLPVIFISGFSAEVAADRGVVEGERARFLQKPFSNEELLAAVAEQLGVPTAATSRGPPARSSSAGRGPGRGPSSSSRRPRRGRRR